MIFNWKSGYFGFMLWDSGSHLNLVLAGLLWHGKGGLPRYCQLGVETQVFYSAFIEFQSEEGERNLDTTVWGWEFRLPTRPLLIPPWCCVFPKAPQTRASQSSLHLSETSYVYIASRGFLLYFAEGIERCACLNIFNQNTFNLKCLNRPTDSSPLGTCPCLLKLSYE